MGSLWIPDQVRDDERGTSLEAIGNATLGEVIGSQFDEHFVADQHANPVLAHLASRVAEYFMAIFQMILEGSEQLLQTRTLRQCIPNALELKVIIFCNSRRLMIFTSAGTLLIFLVFLS